MAKKQVQWRKRWLERIPEASAHLIELAKPRNKRKKYRGRRKRVKYLLKQKYVAFKPSPRLIDMSYSPIRYMVFAKREYRFLKKPIQQNLNKYIQLSAATIYSKLAKIETPEFR